MDTTGYIIRLRERRVYMILKDLLPHIVDNVCIYIQLENGEFEDLFIGKLDYAPSQLLGKNVRLIGAKRKGVLDIQIWK